MTEETISELGTELGGRSKVGVFAEPQGAEVGRRKVV